MSKSSGSISAALETVDDVFFTLNQRWQFEYANASAEYFFSKQDEDLIGKNIWDEFPQIKQRSFYEACLLAAQKMEAVSLEDYYEKANIWYEKNIYPTISGFSIFFRNITKVKNAEKAIKQSNERFNIAALATNDMIWDWNLATDELWWNYNYNKLFGYDDNNVIHHISDWVKSVHPDDRVRVKDGIYKVIELQQNYWSDEYRYLKQDGTVLFIYDRGYVLYNDEGKPYRMIGSMLNITDRIEAQNEIVKEKTISDSIINSLPGIFYLHDDSGVFLRWNKNFEAVTGYNSEEIQKMHPLYFYVEEERDNIREKVLRMLAKTKTKLEILETNLITKEAHKIPYFFTGTKVIVDDKPCLIVVGIDSTEKKKAEESLKKSYDDIRRLASHLTHVREEERKRIGREIHDELGQQLTAIKMDVAWIDKNIPAERSDLKGKLKNVITLLDGSNVAIRRILSELSPGIIDNHGLIAAMERLNTQFVQTTNIPVLFKTDETNIQLNQDIANCIFRVYQEALTNIMRYANATNVSTSLLINNDIIAVNIEDNGDGFDISFNKKVKSFGILGMKERVLSQNGKFILKSAKGEGTSITINLPYKQ